MTKVKNQLSDLSKFVIRSNKLPTLLNFIKIECDDFESCTFTNEELVAEGYVESMVEAGALIIVLKKLDLIDVNYDVSECGELILCRYITVIQ